MNPVTLSNLTHINTNLYNHAATPSPLPTPTSPQIVQSAGGEDATADSTASTTVTLDDDQPITIQPPMDALTEFELVQLHRARLTDVNHTHLIYVIGSLVKAYDIDPKWIRILWQFTERCTNQIQIDPNRRIKHAMSMQGDQTTLITPHPSGSFGQPTHNSHAGLGLVDDQITITPYIKIKTIPGGSSAESKVIDGVIFRKNIAHKKMRSFVPKPRVLLLNCALEFQRAESMSLLNALVEQEKAYIQAQVNKILSWKPDIIVVEKTVNRLAQDLILNAGVTLVLNVKPSLMIRLARAIRAQPVQPANDYIDKCAMIGTCGKFIVEQYTTIPVATSHQSDSLVSSVGATDGVQLAVHTASSSALGRPPIAGVPSTGYSMPSSSTHSTKVIVMSFGECHPPSHATVLLRGESELTLKRIKYILKQILNVSYHLTLEHSLLFDSCATYSDEAVESLLSIYHAKLVQMWGANSEVANMIRAKQNKAVHQLPSPLPLSPAATPVPQSSNPTSPHTPSNDPSSPPPLPQSPPPVRAGWGIPLSFSPFIDMTVIPIPAAVIDIRRQLGFVSSIEPTSPSAAVVQPQPPSSQQPPLWMHDSILFGSTWFSAALQCFAPECKGISFYAETDKTLGQFLLENCFDLKLRCCNEKCGKDVLKHILAYTHHEGRIVITVKKIRKHNETGTLFMQPNSSSNGPQHARVGSTLMSHTTSILEQVAQHVGLGGNESPVPLTPNDRHFLTQSNGTVSWNSPLPQPSGPTIRHPLDHTGGIMMWSRCKLCGRRVTPYMPLSEPTYKISFGRFLDMTFHQTTPICRTGGCTHSIHYNHIRFFGFGGLMASFEYERFPSFAVMTVPRIVSSRDPALINKYQVDLQQTSTLSYIVFEEFIVRIADMDGLLNLQEHRDQLRRLTKKVCMERDRFTNYLQQIGIGNGVSANPLSPSTLPPSSPHPSNQILVDAMDIYRLQRRLLLNFLSWNNKLSDLALIFFPKQPTLAATNKSWWQTANQHQQQLQQQHMLLQAQVSTQTSTSSTVSTTITTRESTGSNAGFDSRRPSSATSDSDSPPSERTSVDHGEISIVSTTNSSVRSDSTSSAILAPIPSNGVGTLGVERELGPDSTAAILQSLIINDDQDSNSVTPTATPQIQLPPPPTGTKQLTPSSSFQQLPPPNNPTSAPAKKAEFSFRGLFSRSNDTSDKQAAAASSPSVQVSPDTLLSHHPSLSPDTFDLFKQPPHLGLPPSLPPIYVPVNEEQPSSIIAYTLASLEHLLTIGRIRPSEVAQIVAVQKWMGREEEQAVNSLDPIQTSPLDKGIHQESSAPPVSVPIDTQPLPPRSMSAAPFDGVSHLPPPIVSSRSPSPDDDAPEIPPNALTPGSAQLQGGYSQMNDGEANVSTPQAHQASAPPVGVNGEASNATSTLPHSYSDHHVSFLYPNTAPSASQRAPPQLPYHLTSASLLGLDPVRDHFEQIESTMTTFTSAPNAQGSSATSSGPGSAASTDQASHTFKYLFHDTGAGMADSVHADSQNYTQPITDPSANSSSISGDLDHRMSFRCTVYFPKQFHALRLMTCGGDYEFIQSLCQCHRFGATGGKSGSTFLKTSDERFILKFITRTELKMFLENGTKYFAYMAKNLFHNLPSFLVKILGVYQISWKKHQKKSGLTSVSSGLSSAHDSAQNLSSQYVLVMPNLFYSHSSTINKIFDLKGSARNRYVKRKNRDENRVLLDDNLMEYTDGYPLPLSDSSKNSLRMSVFNDTLFLSNLEVVDYSLIVGLEKKTQKLIVGIIDYVHLYDGWKKAESAVKSVGMIAGQNVPTIISPQNYKIRFRLAMDRYFMVSPDHFSKLSLLTTNNNSTTTDVADTKPDR